MRCPLSLRAIALPVLALLGVSTAGCSLMPHALQPQQLWKLNRQPPASGDAYFSIPSEEFDDFDPSAFESADFDAGSLRPVQ